MPGTAFHLLALFLLGLSLVACLQSTILISSAGESIGFYSRGLIGMNSYCSYSSDDSGSWSTAFSTRASQSGDPSITRPTSVCNSLLCMPRSVQSSTTSGTAYRIPGISRSTAELSATSRSVTPALDTVAKSTRASASSRTATVGAIILGFAAQGKVWESHITESSIRT